MKNAGEDEEKSMNMYIVKMIVKRVFFSEILGKICVSKQRYNNKVLVLQNIMKLISECE